MSIVLTLFLLAGCGHAEPPAPEAIPTSPLSQQHPGRPLSDAFPLVHVQTHTSFAHDHGDMTRLEAVSVSGKPVKPEEVLAAIVAKRGGYTATGGRSDAEIIATVADFLEAWDAALNIDRQVGAEPSQWLAQALAHSPATYHPPKVSLEEHAGERVVVSRQFVYSHTGRMGNVFLHMVRAYRVSDGMPVQLGPGPMVTQIGGRPY